jgi:hypothetical protein
MRYKCSSKFTNVIVKEFQVRHGLISLNKTDQYQDVIASNRSYLHLALLCNAHHVGLFCCRNFVNRNGFWFSLHIFAVAKHSLFELLRWQRGTFVRSG